MMIAMMSAARGGGAGSGRRRSGRRRVVYYDYGVRPCNAGVVSSSSSLFTMVIVKLLERADLLQHARQLPLLIQGLQARPVSEAPHTLAPCAAHDTRKPAVFSQTAGAPMKAWGHGGTEGMGMGA